MAYQNAFKATAFGWSKTPEENHKKLAIMLEREFQAIQSHLQNLTSSVITVVRGSGGGGGGGGGGSFTGTAITVVQPVTAGTVTVNFPALSSTNYGVYAYVLLSGSLDIGIAKPRIPPDSDTRGLSSVQVITYDTGTLYTSIILAV